MKDGQLRPPGIKSITQCFADPNVKITRIAVIFKDFVEIEAELKEYDISKMNKFKDITTIGYANLMAKQYFNKPIVKLKTYEP